MRKEEASSEHMQIAGPQSGLKENNAGGGRVQLNQKKVDVVGPAGEKERRAGKGKQRGRR